MARGFYREVTRRLKRAGFAYQRNSKGSHEKWVHIETGAQVVVPHNLYARGMAIKILKDAGINHGI